MESRSGSETYFETGPVLMSMEGGIGEKDTLEMMMGRMDKSYMVSYQDIYSYSLSTSLLS